MYVEANHSFRLNFRRGESQRPRRTPADETNDQYHQQPGASRHRPHQQYTCLPHSFPQDTPARASVPTSFLNTYSRWQARLFSRESKGFPEPRIRFASCPNAHSVFRRTYSTHPGSQQPKLQSAQTHNTQYLWFAKTLADCEINDLAALRRSPVITASRVSIHRPVLRNAGSPLARPSQPVTRESGATSRTRRPETSAAAAKTRPARQALLGRHSSILG